jgi:hypothetical protein
MGFLVLMIQINKIKENGQGGIKAGELENESWGESLKDLENNIRIIYSYTR